MLKETSPASGLEEKEQEQTQSLFLCPPQSPCLRTGIFYRAIKHLHNWTFCLANSILNNTLHCLIFFIITVRAAEYFIQLKHCNLCHGLRCPCCWTCRLFSISAVIKDAAVKRSTFLVNYLLI